MKKIICCGKIHGREGILVYVFTHIKKRERLQKEFEMAQKQRRKENYGRKAPGKN